MVERTVVHEGACNKPLASKHVNLYLRKDLEVPLAAQLRFAKSENVVVSHISTL